MLLNQLWAALEEKLEHKSMLNEAKIALEKIKGEWFIAVFFKFVFIQNFEVFPRVAFTYVIILNLKMLFAI